MQGEIQSIVKHGKDSIVALVGLRCSGKSTVGRQLAQLVARPFIDLDIELARAFASERNLSTAPPAGEILTRYGEPAFRDIEEKTLERVLARGEACVIATGGGVVERATNRERLREHAACVWLKVPQAELERRMQSDRGTRPALIGRDPVGEMALLASRRDPLYTQVSRWTIDCGTQSATAIARKIEVWLRG